jgi:hypothetical protein
MQWYEAEVRALECAIDMMVASNESEDSSNSRAWRPYQPRNVRHRQRSLPVPAAGYGIVKTETLRIFDGQQGFTLAQGQ